MRQELKASNTCETFVPQFTCYSTSILFEVRFSYGGVYAPRVPKPPARKVYKSGALPRAQMAPRAS